MRYSNHLILSAPKVTYGVPVETPFMPNAPSNSNTKLGSCTLPSGKPYTNVWEKNHLAAFTKNKSLKKLHVIGKEVLRNPYEESLMVILAKLNSTEESKEKNRDLITALEKTQLILEPRLHPKCVRPAHQASTQNFVKDLTELRETFEKKVESIPEVYREQYTYLDKKANKPGKRVTKVWNSTRVTLDTTPTNPTDGLSTKRLTKHYSSPFLNRIDINFLKSDDTYTKLKYSRCPQYDAVSGGFAALLAGFIGFLISEKFGIELVDSGDFYVALMYGLFVGFSSYTLIKLLSPLSRHVVPVTPYHNYVFFKEVFSLLLNMFLRKAFSVSPNRFFRKVFLFLSDRFFR